MPSFGGLWSDRRSSDSNMLQKGGSFHRVQRSAQNVGHRQKRSSCYVGGDSSVKTNSTMANSLSTTCETSSSSLASINLTSTAANNRKARSKRSNAKSSEGLAASTAATFAAVAAIRESSGDISGAVSGMKAVAGSAPASECVAESTYAEKKTKNEKYNKYKHENKKLKKELDSLREELQLLDKLKTENLQLNMLLESMDRGQKASHEESSENGGNFEEGSGSLMDSIYRGQKVATHDGRTEGKRTSYVGNDSSSNCENNSSEIYLLSTPIVDQKEKDDNISHSSKNSKSSKNSGEESKKSASAAASTSSTHTSKRERRLQSQVKHLATLISQQHEANKKELEEKLAKQEHDLTVLHKKQLQEEIHKMQVRQMTQLEQQQQFYESREKEREAKKEKMEQQPTTTAQDQGKENKQIGIEDTKEFQDLLDRRLQEAIDEALCKSEAEIMFFHNNEVESLRYELQQSREVARKERERAEELGREKRKIEDEYDKIKLRMDRMFFGGWNYSIRGNSNEIPSAPSSAPLPSIVRNQNADDVPADPDVNPADNPSAEEVHVADVVKGGMRRVNSYSVAQDSVLGCLSSSAGDASMKEMKEIQEQLSKMTLEKVKAEVELASLHDKTKNIHVKMLSEIKALTEERDNLKDEVLRLKSDSSRLKAKKGSLQESGDATGCESIDSSFDSSPKSSNHTCERYRNTINFNDKNGINQSKRTSATSTDPTDDNEQNEIDRSETDTESLLAIIAMLRATVDQSTLEKEVLEQRLIEEQERAQQEIRSFAATLEGVEDLRQSAEVMSRELRKIKVKGYNPRSSDFLTGRSCEDLTAVDEADKEMGNALRAVERHGLCGDGSDSRGVKSNGRASSLLTSETGSDYDEKKPRLSVFQTLKSAIADNLVSESLDIENRTEKKGIVEEYDDYEDGDCDEGPFSEEKKKKKKSKKRKNKTDRSVLTSFF